MKARVQVSWVEETVNEGIGSGKIYKRLRPKFSVKHTVLEQKDLDEIIFGISSVANKKRKR